MHFDMREREGEMGKNLKCKCQYNKRQAVAEDHQPGNETGITKCLEAFVHIVEKKKKKKYKKDIKYLFNTYIY